MPLRSRAFFPPERFGNQSFPGDVQLGGASWLLSFCAVLLPPLQLLQGDRDALFFLCRLSHHSPIGSPPDPGGGPRQDPSGAEAVPHLAWKIALSLCELLEPMDRLSWKLLEYSLPPWVRFSSASSRSEWTQCSWSQVGPCGCNRVSLCFLVGAFLWRHFLWRTREFRSHLCVLGNAGPASCGWP